MTRPYSNQKPEVRAFNHKAAQVFLTKFLKEFSQKKYLFARFSRHHELIKHSVYSLKRHMFVKKAVTTMFIDEWDKEARKIKSWTKDIAEAYKKFALGDYFRDFWKYPQYLTQ